MIKVKSFVIKDGRINHMSELDDQINAFISSSEITELIDIKYSSGCAANSVGQLIFMQSAMVIYKSK